MTSFDFLVLNIDKLAVNHTGRLSNRLSFVSFYYRLSENKDADQLCSYCTADLRPCFHII